MQFPGGAAKPAFYIARRAAEVILELCFGQAPIASPPQTGSADQFALCAFDSIAVFHPLFERFGFLFPSSLLQNRRLLAHRQRTVLLIGFNALLAPRALGASLGAPFKPIRNSASGLLLQTAALSILLSGRDQRLHYGCKANLAQVMIQQALAEVDQRCRVKHLVTQLPVEGEVPAGMVTE